MQGLKIYWSDRENNNPPPDASFSWIPFSSKLKSVPHTQKTDLPTPTSYRVIKRTYLPTKEAWIKNVEQALELIDKKELQKVVLARSCILELDRAPDPWAVTAALKQTAKNSFVFCMQSETDAFLGATPERLFTRNNRQIVSEAVAGTRRRGRTNIEDLKLQNQLLMSAKDHLEFSFVHSYLQNALSPLCVSPLSFTPTLIHQTQNVQHLYSKCTGRLKDSITDEEILRHLHPTPALCGTPKEKAFSVIRDLEPFDRGLYGGVLGWSTNESSEWIVGIRSCLLQGKTARLFSGTGIVEGSDPEKEWDELNQKLKLYDEIFI